MPTAKDIRDLRLAMKMNMRDFAKAVGVTSGAICFWENGRSHPRWEHIIRLNELAKKVGVSMAS